MRSRLTTSDHDGGGAGRSVGRYGPGLLLVSSPRCSYIDGRDASRAAFKLTSITLVTLG